MSEKSNLTKKKRSIFSAAVFSGIGTSSRRLFKNVISKTFGAITERFIYTSARAYGVMSLSFGILSLFIYFVKYYILPDGTDIPVSGLIAGAVFTLIGIPLVTIDKPLCFVLTKFPVTDYILFDFFSVKRVDKIDTKKGVSIFSSILIGFIPALISVFVNELYVVYAVILLIFVAVSFVTPEFSVIFTALIAPYLSPIPDRGLTLAFLAVLSAASFGVKLMLGKRFYHFEIFDLGFLLLSALAIISGIRAGEPLNAFVVASMTFGYALTSNLVTNRRLADRVVNAIMVSSVPINIAALLKFILSLTGHGTFNGNVIFASTDSYGAYLLISAVFALSYAIDAKNRIAKTSYILIALISALNLILAWNIGLWLTLIATFIAFFIIRRPKVRKEWLIPTLIAPHLLFLLPLNILTSISNFLHLPKTLTDIALGWRLGVFKLGDSILLGAGVGNSQYIPNTFLSFALAAGTVALGIMLILFLLRLIQLSSYSQYMKHSPLSPLTNAGALAGFAMLSFGMTSDIFTDITLFYIFSSVFGILSASLRLSKNEHDERIGYYGTTRSEDSSDINVRISV